MPREIQVCRLSSCSLERQSHRISMSCSSSAVACAGAGAGREGREGREGEEVELGASDLGVRVEGVAVGLGVVMRGGGLFRIMS